MSKGTTCAKAIQKWEEETGLVASDAPTLKLICQNPPIEKMDNSLNNLVNCTQLSLSTNIIEKIISLPGLKNLQVLSLARNQIKKISGLEEVGNTLEQLWLSYNQIEKLDGLQCCIRLQVLYMSNNKIKAVEEVDKLATLPEISNILFKGNPFYDGHPAEETRRSILKRAPNLKTIDGEMVTEDMREKVLSLE